MVLGDHVEIVRTKARRSFNLRVYAVEPVADIAVLGTPDELLPKDAAAFEAFVGATRAVPVCVDDFEWGAPVPVNVLAHKGGWIRANATRYGEQSAPPGWGVFIQAEHDIKGGTSGGPVVDDAGRLVGIVSNAGGAGVTREGTMPRPHLALPRWLWHRIEAAQKASAEA